MEETPLVQVLLAVATKWTGDDALPRVGEETATDPNAETANKRTQAKEKFT